MSTHWDSKSVYISHAFERATLAPNQFKALDRSHLASRISLAASDSGFASVLLGLGKLANTDYLEVKEGYRPTQLRGVQSLKTQAAHRGSGCTWVSISKERDPQRFSAVSSRIPPRFVSNERLIRAPLHLFAGSTNGAAMLLGSERAATVLPAWENRLNSYMEFHGEREARNQLLRAAERFKSTDTTKIAVYTLDQLYSHFVPSLVNTATKMMAYFDMLAQRTNRKEDTTLAGHAEECRDFLRSAARNREVLWAGDSLGLIPAASFGPLQKSLSALSGFESRTRRDDAVDGWTERRVGAVDLIVPTSSTAGSGSVSSSSDSASPATSTTISATTVDGGSH